MELDPSNSSNLEQLALKGLKVGDTKLNVYVEGATTKAPKFS